MLKVCVLLFGDVMIEWDSLNGLVVGMWIVVLVVLIV